MVVALGLPLLAATARPGAGGSLDTTESLPGVAAPLHFPALPGTGQLVGVGDSPSLIPDPFALAWPTPEPVPAVEVPRSRFQLPLKRWSSVTDRYGAPRPNRVRHGGIDLAVDGMPASPVYASCEGIVEGVVYSSIYGYHVVLDCGDGWSTLHAHLRQMLVVPGQAVTFTDVIGLTGRSGQAEGEHLHFEIRWHGAAVNPEHYLDFGIPPGTPLTRDRRDADGNLITPTPPATPAPESTQSPASTPATSVTPTATPTPAETPTPSPTPPEPATQPPGATPTPTPPDPAGQPPAS